MKKLQFIDIGKPFRIIGKICKDIERAFRFKGINVNFIVMMIDYIGFAFILKWNLQSINKLHNILWIITLLIIIIDNSSGKITKTVIYLYKQ